MDTERQLGRQSAALARLFDKQMNVGGAGLGAKLARAGRAVPRRVRREAAVLVEAEAMLAHPKLRKQIDPRRLDRSYHVSAAWLGGLDPADRRKGRVLGFLATVVVNLGLLATGIVVLMIWRGLV